MFVSGLGPTLLRSVPVNMVGSRSRRSLEGSRASSGTTEPSLTSLTHSQVCFFVFEAVVSAFR